MGKQTSSCRWHHPRSVNLGKWRVRQLWPWSSLKTGGALEIILSEKPVRRWRVNMVSHRWWTTDSSNHLILCHSLLLLPSVFPSIRVLSNESVLHIRCPKYWSFNFSISPSNEHSGLIFFRTDWFDFLAVWRTLKSLCQRHSSKASILQCSAFVMVQLSHLYMTTGKTIALTRQTFLANLNMVGIDLWGPLSLIIFSGLIVLILKSS